MKKMNGWNIWEDSLIHRLTPEGLLTSDLSIAAIVLCLVDGTVCERAIKDERSNRFLWEIKGDPAKIKEFIDDWYGGRPKKHIDGKVDLLRTHAAKTSYLKVLLDKARVKVEDARPEASPTP